MAVGLVLCDENKPHWVLMRTGQRETLRLAGMKRKKISMPHASHA